MAIYDSGPVLNVNGAGQRIGDLLYVSVENTAAGNLPANAFIEVYSISPPNSQGFTTQTLYAQRLVALAEFGSPVGITGPVHILSVTLNPINYMYGVRLTTYPDPGGGSQISASLFAQNSFGEIIGYQRILLAEMANVTGTVLNPYLQAVNEAQNATEMRAAIEDPELGLDLTEYNALTEAQKNEVAEILLNNRPISGYSSVPGVQIALEAAVEQVTVDPDNIYVQAGSVGGDGSPAHPFGTIPEGIAAAAAFGTVHILSGTYPVTSTINVNKLGITLLGEAGTLLMVSAPGPVFLPLLISSADVTVDGLTLTSDAPYQTEFIQIGANNVTLTHNTIYGPAQALPMANWVVNRAVVSQGNVTNMLIADNTFYSLRTGMYINPGGTGAINNNIVYNTKGGFLVDRALTTFLGNAWGTPPNEFDIVLLAGTTTGPPYNDLSQLSVQNNNATISDQR